MTVQPAQWHQILSTHPEANFLQSPEWAKVNQKIGHKVIVRAFARNGLALMIVKNARRGRYLEIPGGPLLNWDDRSLVKAAFAEIRQVANENHCVFIRFRPQLLNRPNNLALLPSDARLAPFHLHADHTVIIDLSKSEDDLLAAMRRQTRYEVRQSIKKGLVVEKGNSRELFELFHRVQVDTAARQHFIPPKLSDLLAYREAFGDSATIYYVYKPEAEPAAKQPPSKTKQEVFRRPNNLVALGLIIANGNEADYFEAASTELNRKLPGAYALQWQAIQDLKKQGIERYNLWGIAPPGQPHHRYAGVTTFKTGFGGQVTEYIPAHDIIISKPKYLRTYLIETIRKKRRHLS